jgi:hypothetical protein
MQIIKQIGSIEKIRKFNAKLDNFCLTRCRNVGCVATLSWPIRHTFMANSLLLAIGDRVAYRGYRGRFALCYVHLRFVDFILK